MTQFQPPKTIAAAVKNQTEQDVGPLAIYSIITDWVEQVVEATLIGIHGLESAQMSKQGVSQTEKQRFIRLARQVLIDFHRDLSSIYGRYKHSWKSLYTADAMEMQQHIQKCLDALDPQLHLRINIQLIQNIVVHHILTIVDERAPLIKKYNERTPASSRAMAAFEYSRAIAKEKEEELNTQTLQLVGV